MNIDKYYESTNSLISGIILIVLGFVLIFLNENFYKNIVLIVTYSFLLIGIKNSIMFFIKKNKNKNEFLSSLFNLIFATFLTINTNLSLSILPIVLGIYFLINFILQLISTIIIIRNKDKGSIFKFLLSFAYLIIAIILIFNPLTSIRNLLISSGIYFILLGVNYIYDFITIVLPVRYKNKIKRRFRFTLPVIIEAIIPYQVLNYINRTLDSDEEKIQYQIKKNEENVDLEIIIHVSPNGFNRMGHVDICINNEVLSYGNYDINSKKFFDIFGDGVIFIANRDDYIPFVIERNNKTLFTFGLKLNNKQKDKVNKYIENLKKDLVEWKSPYQIDNDNKHNDYASALYKRTKASFYKFKKGNLKTYFLLGNNCCFLADSIIGKCGIDQLKMNGIITPGTYYEYLNKEFMKKKSMVVSKNIYNEKRKGDKSDKKQIYSKRKRKYQSDRLSS